MSPRALERSRGRAAHLILAGHDVNESTSGFSADTEILTRGQGWVTFDRLTLADEVATRSPEGRFEWQHPERVDVRRYDGDMVHLHSRTTDLLVTPGTQIWYMHRKRVMVSGKRHDEYEERAVATGGVIGQRLPLVATSRWEPDAPLDSFSLVATRAQTYGGRLANYGRNFTASAADFAAFMGMYLAEGSLSSPKSPGYYIWIWQQTAGKGFREYQELLDGLLDREVPWLAGKGCWHFSNKALWEYLRLCGNYAWTKRIPRDILDLPTDDLEVFWHYYWLGDGTWMQAGADRKPLEVIPTTSREMAGGLQEILQKLGGWSMIQTVDYTKYEKIGAISRLIYRLVRRAGEVAFASKIERVPCVGPVGDVKSGDHAVYVRRNYRPVWAGGNSR